MNADAIGSASIERPALTTTPEDRWRLYFSYVEPRARQGIVLPVGRGWDARMARLTCTVPLERGHLAFYDGRATVEQNFEEQLGLAYSYDLLRWLRLTPDTPWRSSPHGGGALRYVVTAVDGGVLRLVYEYARSDGAHEVRENRLPWRRTDLS